MSKFIILLTFIFISIVTYNALNRKKQVNCSISDWGEFSACTQSCGGGIQSRSRTITRPPSGGGAACPPESELKQTQACNTQPCPVDCIVSDWSEFSDCSQPCGGGTQTRIKSIITPSSGGGAVCPPESELKQTQACNIQSCQDSNTDPYNTIINYIESGIPKSIELKTGSYNIGSNIMTSPDGYGDIDSIILAPNSYIRLWIYSSEDGYLSKEYKNTNFSDFLTINSDGSNHFKYEYYEPENPAYDSLLNITISYNNNPYCDTEYIEESQYNYPVVPIQTTNINTNETVIQDYTNDILDKTCLIAVWIDNLQYDINDSGVIIVFGRNSPLFLNQVDVFLIVENDSGDIIQNIKLEQYQYRYTINYTIKSDTNNNKFKIKIVNKIDVPVTIGGNIRLTLVNA